MLRKIKYDLLAIVDINLDFLRNIEYTEIEEMEEGSLEKMLYIFICDNKENLDKLYVGDEIMKKVSKKLESYDNPIDQYFIYDKAALEQDEREELAEERGRREGKIEEKIEVVKKMIGSYQIEEISRIVGLSMEDIKGLELEKGQIQ